MVDLPSHTACASKPTRSSFSHCQPSPFQSSLKRKRTKGAPGANLITIFTDGVSLYDKDSKESLFLSFCLRDCVSSSFLPLYNSLKSITGSRNLNSRKIFWWLATWSQRNVIKYIRSSNKHRDTQNAENEMTQVEDFSLVCPKMVVSAIAGKPEDLGSIPAP